MEFSLAVLLIIIFTMGVSLQQYRYAIGSYNGNSKARNLKLSTRQASHDEPLETQYGLSIYILFYFYIFIIFYMFMYMMTIILQSSNYITSYYGRVKNQQFSPTSISLCYSLSLLKHINTLYLTTLCHVITISTSKCNPISRYFKHSLLSMKRFIEASTLIYTSTISILLIVISNFRLLNPGPKLNSIHDSGISTFYQNVHGLLTYSSLGSKYPVLNITKVLELQSYRVKHLILSFHGDFSTT